MAKDRCCIGILIVTAFALESSTASMFQQIELSCYARAYQADIWYAVQLGTREGTDSVFTHTHFQHPQWQKVRKGMAACFSQERIK